MRRAFPALLLLAAAVLAGCSDAEPAPAPAPAETTGSPTAAPTAYDQYVALGDSYTAAPLVPPTDTSTICLRSGVNYPALVATAMPGTRLTDVSCSGAGTVHMTTPQQGMTGTVPPQFDALTPGTDLVTIGIGGNDEGLFGAVLGACTKLATAPPGSTCVDQLQQTATATLARIRANVAGVVEGVRQRSPEARILVVGYPQIVPGSGTCEDLPLAADDYPFARQVNEGLTQALQDAAADTQVEYVDVWGPSAGHDICSDVPWINGRVTSADRALAYHPLAVEQQAVAGLVVDALQRGE
ncbi:SGNH/GDSL hydrolase family protein [Nocardioides hankookensis]|uniref:SGNH/GDSL hydrolase family protein n=1 Tax=Nocardioides hankookensis TaxID=443157 RepID=A0ABW1LHR4_9ACTN